MLEITGATILSGLLVIKRMVGPVFWRIVKGSKKNRMIRVGII